jgi:predicted AAA+ superfamily ATPase
LKNAIGRVESPWRPASAEESFEIVRRRLFQPTSDPELFVQRDAVIRSFMDMYRTQSPEFPSECKEAIYEGRIKNAYPIHPELFDRLYSDWSALDRFQRTRGVLRLMAKVIHSLWERNDHSLMIMPAHVPMDDLQVQSELTRYLDDNWIPIIDKDVDGSNSLPLSLDRHNPNLGRYSACRRVTRTIYMGSAPTLRAANRGIDDRHVKLGCVQPGEIVSTFSDALRRLTDQATYLYVDGNRYWISTQPNVNRTALERAEQLLHDLHFVWEEIIKRLKTDKNRGEFSAVHIAPESTADIPDAPNLGVRLIVLSPIYGHSRGVDNSPARQWVANALNSRGSSPRYYKNTLLFLCADGAKLEILAKNTAQYLAWKGIIDDKDSLNLDVFQAKQANTKLKQSNDAVEAGLKETYQWLLIPHQPNAQSTISIEWKETRLTNQDSPILQASRKAVHESDLLTTYAASILRMEALDKFLWRDANHINLEQLWEYLTQYLYLPRLKNEDVLLDVVRNGVASTAWTDNFAYSEDFDPENGKYLGLKAGTGTNPSISSKSLLVKPEIAQQQLTNDPQRNNEVINPILPSDPQTVPLTPIVPPPKHRRFYGSVNLDAMRINRDGATIANEVIQHLTALNGATVKITLEIEADIPDGVPDNVERTIMENCRTLRFNNQSFEIS